MVLPNPTTGQYHLKTQSLQDLTLDVWQRSSHYSIIWIESGSGCVKYDLSEYRFTSDSVFFFVPHQPFMLTDTVGVQGIIIQFASDFYCIEKHRQEISCSGVLFSNVYASPSIQLDGEGQRTFEDIVNGVCSELACSSEPDPVLILSYLRILLIKSTRIKKAQMEVHDEGVSSTHYAIRILIELIEDRYRTLKRPMEYAKLLNLSPKTLSKLVKMHFGRTLTEVIQERVILEAKRELILTDKLVRQIAFELGYGDEYYFSRLFKKHTSVSPERFRKLHTPG